MQWEGLLSSVLFHRRPYITALTYLYLDVPSSIVGVYPLKSQQHNSQTPENHRFLTITSEIAKKIQDQRADPSSHHILDLHPLVH